IPGPAGMPVVGNLVEFGRAAGQPHRWLAELAAALNPSAGLMALQLGSTRLVVASKPEAAREILSSPCFGDRPIKQSAQELMFGRAIGFAPQGEHWRRLRRIAAHSLFSPRRMAAQEHIRLQESEAMLGAIRRQGQQDPLPLRCILQQTSVRTMMRSVFGWRSSNKEQEEELVSMVREGFDLLGAVNWADHIPLLKHLDAQAIQRRSRVLAARVSAFVGGIIRQHRLAAATGNAGMRSDDFVDVLLALQGEDELQDDDIVAVLWEMIFRGTDTTAILTEWVLAELVVHPDIQRKLHLELDATLGAEDVRDDHVHRLTYLQAVVKETLRLHPPGPLLSWSRLCTQDTTIAGGHHVPKGTNAMVNMWAITHDSTIWTQPHRFLPERFMAGAGGADMDVKGSDLRLAPFGSGRRVCPGRALGLATVHLWVARLLQKFEWLACTDHPVELQEVLKLSAEMAKPLRACPVPRRPM
ncbi:hypothetical protein SELMODRAFT_1587, partial [Selaginella moellendorffii]